MRSHLLAASSLIALLTAGCSEASLLQSKNDSAEDASGSYGGAEAPASDTDGLDAGDDTDLPAEEENDFLKLLPAATTAYVFVANASRGTVTRVSVPNLDVITVEVGVDPAVVKTTADYTRAVVFNRGSDDISVIDAESLEVETVAVRDNFNQMMLSPDGRWAIAFHDSDLDDEETGSTGGVVSYNEISVVDLDTLSHYPMIVGHNPHDVQFTPDSSLALVVADDELAIVDLIGDRPSSDNVQLTTETDNPPRAEEVAISPDGSYAFVRQFGANEILVVDLALAEVTAIPAGSNPTDLDITPDGRFAAVVARGSGEIFLFSTSNPFLGGSVVDVPPTETIGSVTFTPDGRLGILYSTAAADGAYTSWDLETDEMEVHTLWKPVSAVAVTPPGTSLMIFHQDVDLSYTDEDYIGRPLLTLVDLDTFDDNPLALAAEPTAFANSEDGLVGYFLMEDWAALEVIDYTSLLTLEVELKAVPVHVGVLPDTDYAYVNQEHDLGRLTFYDPGDDPWDDRDDTIETITGFELNSAIEH